MKPRTCRALGQHQLLHPRRSACLVPEPPRLCPATCTVEEAEAWEATCLGQLLGAPAGSERGYVVSQVPHILGGFSGQHAHTPTVTAGPSPTGTVVNEGLGKG